METTDDGRWIVVDGRRWRASDPAIPEKFRAELVNELMAARRDSGRRLDVEAARDRVQDAKVALGERGPRWWDEPTDEGDRLRLAAAIRALLHHRAAAGSSICPSDAARAVGGDRWRTLLPAARDVARELAAAGTIEITQGGVAVASDRPWKGPVRLRFPPS